MQRNVRDSLVQGSKRNALQVRKVWGGHEAWILVAGLHRTTQGGVQSTQSRDFGAIVVCEVRRGGSRSRYTSDQGRRRLHVVHGEPKYGTDTRLPKQHTLVHATTYTNECTHIHKHTLTHTHTQIYVTTQKPLYTHTHEYTQTHTPCRTPASWKTP